MFIGVYKHKVLVVDDDPLMASVLGELMCAHGYDVNVMNSAIEAISEIEKEIPSLIISDINMPDMDGYEFCRTIRGPGDIASKSAYSDWKRERTIF
jgi:CheY-like chemotaxis protein